MSAQSLEQRLKRLNGCLSRPKKREESDLNAFERRAGLGWNLTGIHAVVIQKVRRFIEQRRQPRRLAGKKLMDLTYAKHDRAAPRNEDTVVVRKHAKVFVLPQIARSRFFPADTFGAEVQFVCIDARLKRPITLSPLLRSRAQISKGPAPDRRWPCLPRTS
jgi:hypothetical protein